MSGQKIYKENIIDRIGGPMDDEMAVIDLCDRWMQDKTLKYHFRNMGSAALSKFQTELLELAFLDQSAAGNNHVDNNCGNNESLLNVVSPSSTLTSSKGT
jgi:hypothetical protein